MKESSFQFQNPRVKYITFEVGEDYQQDQQSSFTNKYNTEISRFNDDRNRAVVELTVKIGDEGSVNIPYKISMIIGAIFKWEQEFDDDTINKLLSINAPMLLLGYARPIVAFMTAASGLNSYNIPFINFTTD